MSTPFLYFEFYNADFKCQVLGIFAFPTTTKPQHPPTCTLHSGFCSQKSWVISWLLNMLGEMFSIYNFKRRSFKFKYLHEMSFKVLLLHVFHSFIHLFERHSKLYSGENSECIELWLCYFPLKMKLEYEYLKAKEKV